MTERVKRESVRLCLWISLAIVAASAALSSRSLIATLRAFRNAEASGLLSVGSGIAEANQLLLGGLYVGLLGMLIATVLYLRSSNKLATSLWSSVMASTLTLGLVLTLWIAESTMIDALPLSQDGVVESGAVIDWLLLITLFSGATLAGLLFLGSFLRVSLVGTRRRRSGGLVFFMAIALGVAVVAFHLRNAWIYELYKQFA